jgi:hypothetical protein
MATRYTFQCPNQSYGITLEMCRARQSQNTPKCASCKCKPEGATTCQQKLIV